MFLENYLKNRMTGLLEVKSVLYTEQRIFAVGSHHDRVYTVHAKNKCLRRNRGRYLISFGPFRRYFVFASDVIRWKRKSVRGIRCFTRDVSPFSRGNGNGNKRMDTMRLHR